MNDGPCPDHPDAPVLGGLCAACTYWPFPVPGCRSTVHCANYGFCSHCQPKLTRASFFALEALREVGREWDGDLYGKVMETIRRGMGDFSESSSSS